MRRTSKLRGAMLAGLILASSIRPLAAQEAARAAKDITFYVDQESGQVFIRPAKSRVPLMFGGAAFRAALEQTVEEKTRDEVRAAVAESEAAQRAQTAELQKQVAEIKPAWKSYLNNFQNKFRIGALFYADYGLYTHTGFGPQFLENQNPPGPGNNFFNAFDISRVYLNTYFSPTDDWTFRFTPEIYRANGANQTTTSCLTTSGGVCSLNDKFGATSAVGSNLDGALNVRLKFAFLQNSALWNEVPALEGGTLTIGAQPNPLLGWEEDFTQYRFVYLSPWNYLGLSSSQIGFQFAGPVTFRAGEDTYLDYAVGAYDNGNFRTQEQTNTKQVMGRLTAYPFGAAYRYQGLGITGFWNYGWGNTTPDNQGTVTPLKGGRAQFQRMAAILSYAAEQWNILGEFDYGKNAFQLGNLFTASGPADAFGTPTGTPVGNAANTLSFAGNSKCGKLISSTPGTPCYPLFNTFGPQTAIYQAILNNGRAREWGVDFLGHYHIPGTKLSIFGMYQWFIPNDQFEGPDPLDFQRFIAGVSYQYNEYIRFALDSQNLLFYHDQQSISTAYASGFGYSPGGKFNGWLLPKTGSIPDTVPRDTHTIFANLEFAY